jgi:Vanadium chloroperoxidase N-terminal domain/PAP2 superfamily
VDHILYWNNAALEANRRDFSNVAGTSKPAPEQGGPTLSSRALAIVHLGMYDAHAGVAGNPASLPAYLPGLPTPAPGASAAAAVAGAAHALLSKLYRSQIAKFDADLANAGLSGPGVPEGLAFGVLVADALWADRLNDPDAGAQGYSASLLPGRHRVDPANPGQGFHAPYYGARSKCFSVSQRHSLSASPKPGSKEYQKSVRQVREKGIAPKLMGTLPDKSDKRTAAETLIGIFWAYDGVRELGTPPRLYNLILREMAKQQNNSVDDNARLFALVNAALGDAGILAWDQKYLHDVWRPVVGIREHDGSMGPAAPKPDDDLGELCDPDWLPLGAPHSNSFVREASGVERSDRDFTPPFPAYPSGHATFGAAALHMIRLFYGIKPGDRKPDKLFKSTLCSEELNGMTSDTSGVVRPKHVRKFKNGLWQMIEENGFSRVYLGVHWSFDAFDLDTSGNPDLSKNIGGVPLGLKIAEDIFNGGRDKGLKKSTVAPRTP